MRPAQAGRIVVFPRGQRSSLTEDEIVSVTARLARVEKAGKRGPWTAAAGLGYRLDSRCSVQAV